jgi:uracil-DNA glycosylase
MAGEREAALAELRRAAAGCTDCELYREGTQTVFGEGPAAARFMFVGEQPGDREDREGHPFVGPAVLVTVHPSSILRAADEDRATAMRAFVRDLAILTQPAKASAGRG